MSSTRQRMIDSAIRIIRAEGAKAVTIDAVLADTRAPRGSVYHHFPGGRRELVSVAAEQSAAFMTAQIHRLATLDPAAIVTKFTRVWTAILSDSDYAAGCPIVALTTSPSHPDDIATAARSFEVWQASLRESGVRAGWSDDAAQEFATLAIAAIEGAIVICRARRTTEPLTTVGKTLVNLADHHS
ncbi:TetR/AcrR family transcriptional regulator [Mycolicibacterium sp. A43C]